MKDDEDIFHQNMTTAHTGKHQIPIPKMLIVIRMDMEWSWRRIGRPLLMLQSLQPETFTCSRQRDMGPLRYEA